MVTGGNSCIGPAVAHSFRREEERLAILGRDPTTLAAAAHELGPETLAVRGDIARIEQLDRLFSAVESGLGRSDILVASAAPYYSESVDQKTPGYFDTMNDVNLRGSLFTLQRALPHLRDGASNILVTSTANTAGILGFSICSATKAAVRSLARRSQPNSSHAGFSSMLSARV